MLLRTKRAPSATVCALRFADIYALQTIQKMNSKAIERQAAEAAILATFTLHYSLSRRLRVVDPGRASRQYDLALATYEENPGLRQRMREIAPGFLLMKPCAGDHLVPPPARLVVKPISLFTPGSMR